MVREDFVTFEQAKSLKELGFNWTSYNYYEDDGSLIVTSYDEYYSEFEGRTTAPSLSQAQKWLRDVKNIYTWVEVEMHDSDKPEFPIYLWDENNKKLVEEGYISKDTYEQALLTGIDKAIALLKTL